MPIFVYEHDVPPRDCTDRFEQIERAGAPPRIGCPQCGAPVHRVPSALSAHKNTLSTGHLKDHGFTRLRRKDKGVYEVDR